MALRLSEKHGVNPSVGVCFWCGKDDGTVILAGRMRGDVEAPHRAVYSYEPCDSCKAGMAQGVALIEVDTLPMKEGMPPINGKQLPSLYPTGRYVVVRPEFIERVFEERMALAVTHMGKGYIDTQVFEALFGEALREKEDAETG